MRQMISWYDYDKAIRYSPAAWYYKSYVRDETMFPTQIIIFSDNANTWSHMMTTVYNEIDKKEYE